MYFHVKFESFFAKQKKSDTLHFSLIIFFHVDLEIVPNEDLWQFGAHAFCNVIAQFNFSM